MAMRFSDSDELYSFLLGFVNVEKGQRTVFKLDRMRALCERLGDPQGAYRSIHVAGSKGKGSVSMMMARILQASGRRVGLYTSPHLLRWKERMSLAGDEMPEEPVLEAASEVLNLVEGKEASDFPGDELPTYFELTTLIAFCAFRRVGCDYAVIETGLGGRLDSTNVIEPAACAITPIELEHTEWLGDTIELIAAEKAGIIKPGRPCYVSRQRPEARHVFVETCRERSSPLREAPELAVPLDVAIDGEGTKAKIIFAAGSPYAAGVCSRSHACSRHAGGMSRHAAGVSADMQQARSRHAAGTQQACSRHPAAGMQQAYAAGMQQDHAAGTQQACSRHAAGTQQACSRHAAGVCRRHAAGTQQACSRHAAGVRSGHAAGT